MSVPESPEAGPPLDVLSDAFYVYDVRTDGDRVVYYGEPLVQPDELLERVWPAFREAGYEVHLSRDHGEFVLVAEPKSVGIDGIPWTNVVLALATVVSTLFAGSLWYHIDVMSNPAHALAAWPFTVAIMGVLGVHEFGHYAMTRYHDVDASLPYFIPVPSIIGTMGAVIRMKGQMPDREALFDIGVAGPLAGLIATVVVTAVGLFLSPVTAPPEVVQSGEYVTVTLGYPPLLQGIAWVTGQPLTYEGARQSLHPIVIAGWVGMLVTFLNLIPAGQLDGGHILRAILGDRQETIAALVPGALFALAGYLYFVEELPAQSVTIWAVWGVFATLVTVAGPADPVDDRPLDRKRAAIGLVTLLFGALCFTPVPILISG